jgi:hypothetical protein
LLHKAVNFVWNPTKQGVSGLLPGSLQRAPMLVMAGGDVHDSAVPTL